MQTLKEHTSYELFCLRNIDLLIWIRFDDFVVDQGLENGFLVDVGVFDDKGVYSLLLDEYLVIC